MQIFLNLSSSFWISLYSPTTPWKLQRKTLRHWTMEVSFSALSCPLSHHPITPSPTPIQKKNIFKTETNFGKTKAMENTISTSNSTAAWLGWPASFSKFTTTASLWSYICLVSLRQLSWPPVLCLLQRSHCYWSSCSAFLVSFAQMTFQKEGIKENACSLPLCFSKPEPYSPALSKVAFFYPVSAGAGMDGHAYSDNDLPLYRLSFFFFPLPLPHPSLYSLLIFLKYI